MWSKFRLSAALNLKSADKWPVKSGKTYQTAFGLCHSEKSSFLTFSAVISIGAGTERKTGLANETSKTEIKAPSGEMVRKRKTLKYLLWNFCVPWPFLVSFSPFRFSRFARFREEKCLMNVFSVRPSMSASYVLFSEAAASAFSWWSIFMLPPPKKALVKHIQLAG